MSRARRLIHRVRRQLLSRGADVSDIRDDDGRPVVYVWGGGGFRPYRGHVVADHGGDMVALRYMTEAPQARTFRAPMLATKFLLEAP